MSRRQYSDEQKAAVMAALLAGQSVEQVAEEYHIPAGTIKSWQFRQNGTPVATVATEKKEEIGELILAYLREILVTLREQAVHFRDKSWLDKQSASEVAVLHGVSTDKAIRLLEALAGDDPGAGGDKVDSIPSVHPPG